MPDATPVTTYVFPEFISLLLRSYFDLSLLIIYFRRLTSDVPSIKRLPDACVCVTNTGVSCWIHWVVVRLEISKIRSAFADKCILYKV